MSTLHAGSLLVIVLLVYVIFRWLQSRDLRLPPGPRKLPLIGNLLDMPSGRDWLTYAKWCRQYDSDIIHLSVAGQSVVVLNSAELASDLLEKKSSIYSSRVQLTMLHELIGWNHSFTFKPYDAAWRSQRKVFTQTVNPSDAAQFFPHQINAAHEFLRRLLSSSNLFHDIHHWAAVMIMDITYGIRGEAADPYISTAIEALDGVARAATPGAFLVDYLPFLKYVPGWVPGAGFQQKAKKWSTSRYDMTEKPFQAAKRQIATGVYTPSLISSALANMDLAQDISIQEDVMKGVAVTCYGAGFDTIVATLAAFILAMLLHPEVQTSAQQELDKVLGEGDLPTFNDEPSLPYITALVKEVLRYSPAIPLGVPHLSEEDDTHDGYWIPKGSIVIANSWSMLHNEETYPDPSSFNPARFLTTDGKLNPECKDPATAAFGFGRRICPGRHFAISAVWIAVASILATYNITKDVDADGKVIEPSGEWSHGSTLFNHPLPFKCTFTPRSKAAEVAIRATGEDP
ncbi:cytochrome P450 monooxygenase 31 [Heterobasidion irregulare TC 32-1]|uniref:Cytochrome P450 monooxygenase 31 n=1 Tax=Heterobasidion irregulare (strain TC 32-1) TaxID=747525 RepID=W4JW27_HETIT|nr:cytochrome P450 monooxygenase 31 [Heterobasidion irregulare TC 32-1]ETW77757.1 cytochrome P450 monooxygenase 31 [Heterobasidion irregulare TC 32-1]